MSDTKAVTYETEIPNVLQALADVQDVMDAHGLDRVVVWDLVGDFTAQNYALLNLSLTGP